MVRRSVLRMERECKLFPLVKTVTYPRPVKAYRETREVRWDAGKESTV